MALSMRFFSNTPMASAAVCELTTRQRKPHDLVVALRTDEMGVICDWEKANNPNFKIFYSNGQNDQARFALTAAMMKNEGKDVPPTIDVPFKMHEVTRASAIPQFLKAHRLIRWWMTT